MARALLCLAGAWIAVLVTFWLSGSYNAIATTWSGTAYSLALTAPVAGFLTLALFFPGIIAALSSDAPPLIISLPLAIAICAISYAALAHSVPGEIITLTWRGSRYSISLASGVAAMFATAYLIAFLVALGRGTIRLSFTTGRTRGHTR